MPLTEYEFKPNLKPHSIKEWTQRVFLFFFSKIRISSDDFLWAKLNVGKFVYSALITVY